MMKKVITACLFCLLVTGGISFGDGYIVNKSTVAGQPGVEVANLPLSVCDPNLTCDGTKIIDVVTGKQVELCWTVAAARCASGPILVEEVGTHYFTIVSYTDDETVTYQRWNETTQQYEDASYLMPGGTSMPSNEVVLVVRPLIDVPIPPTNGSCSIRKLLP